MNPLHKIKLGLPLAFFGVTLFLALSTQANSLKVSTSIPPQAGLIEKIGGDLLEVQVLLPPGQDPHTFSPSPKQVEQLAHSDLFFTIHMPFERRLLQKLKVNSTALKIVDTTVGAHRIPNEESDHTHHDHSSDSKVEMDPHIWLSPSNLKLQINIIADELSLKLPQQKVMFEKNRSALQKRLSQIDEDFKKKFAPHKGSSVYVFHPAFGYFTNAYGLKQKHVESHGKRPTPRQLRSLVKEAKKDHVQFVLLQPQVDPTSANIIAHAIGASIVTIDPLGHDILSRLEELARVVKKALAR